MAHIAHNDLLTRYCDALACIGTLSDILTLRLVNYDAARAAEKHVFHTITFDHEHNRYAIDDLRRFLDLCRCKDRILRHIRTVRISPNGGSWDDDRWLLSNTFADLASLLATIQCDEPVLTLRVARRALQRPIDGRLLERALSPFARNVHLLQLSDIEGLPNSFFKHFMRLSTIDISGVALLPMAKDPTYFLPVIDCISYSARPPITYSDWQDKSPDQLPTLLDLSTVRSISSHTDCLRDLKFLTVVPPVVWDHLERLSIDVSGLYDPHAGHTLDIRAAPKLGFLQLRLTVNKVERDVKAMDTPDGGPLGAIVCILNTIQGSTALRLELVFEIEGALDWENWQWAVLDKALVAFAEKHYSLMLKLEDRPHLFQLPRPFSLHFARCALTRAAECSRIQFCHD
ncbi:hypothetical protein BKA70DRAFT_1351036 [Coprinopsis sp. MPI-PUGE-AT-0042]|nr:hypothetical protein BKA70DRAFT_1351036 [Coprinopsis sp. MPI-PUGE-AT-0042]